MTMPVVTAVVDRPGLDDFFKRFDNAMQTGIPVWMMTNADDYIKGVLRERFKSEGDSTVGKWAPLKPMTVAERRADGYPGDHPILHKTGELERWVLSAGKVTPGVDITTLDSPGSPATGVLLEKAQTSQKGGVSRKGNRVPARPIFALNGNDATAIVLSLQERLTHLLGGMA